MSVQLGIIQSNVGALERICYNLHFRERVYGRCMVFERIGERSLRGQRAVDSSGSELFELLKDVFQAEGTVFQHHRDAYGVCIFRTKEEMTDHSITAYGKFLSSFIGQRCKLQVRIGIGALVFAYGDMGRSIQSAIQALERGSEQERIILYEDNGHRERNALLENVKRKVEATYMDPGCSLKNISRSLFVNSAYLGRLFKEKEGVSFKDFLNGYRMERAKELLARSDKKVYEVAYEVGYREVDWFYKKFKECTGMSTQEFRSRYEVLDKENGRNMYIL